MPIIIVLCGIPHVHSLNEATIMQKFLAAFFVVAGFTLPLTYGVAQAEPVSKTAKKPAKQAATKAQDSEAINVAGLTSSQYSCELGNKFTVIVNGIKVHDNITVDRATGSELDGNVNDPGAFFVQGDHGNVAFRNLRVKEITNQ